MNIIHALRLLKEAGRGHFSDCLLRSSFWSKLLRALCLAKRPLLHKYAEVEPNRTSSYSADGGGNLPLTNLNTICNGKNYLWGPGKYEKYALRADIRTRRLRSASVQQFSTELIPLRFNAKISSENLRTSVIAQSGLSVNSAEHWPWNRKAQKAQTTVFEYDPTQSYLVCHKRIVSLS